MTKRPRNSDGGDPDLPGPVQARARLAVDDVDPLPSAAASGSAGAERSPNSETPVRILCWNVDTPVPFLQLPKSKLRSAASTSPGIVPGSDPRLLRKLLRRHAFPDFVCLQEVRARHSDKEWIAALRLAANFGTHRAPEGADAGPSGDAVGTDAETAEPKYTMFHSLNRAVRAQRHFGVATFVRAPSAVAAAREVDWDAEGRVLVLEMKAGWALVNVYALNGSEFMWRDPLGAAPPKTRNERKREFNRLLLGECLGLQRRGLRVVLVGDFNIALTEEDCHPRLRTEYPHGLARTEFREQFIAGANVVDVFRERHPDLRAYSWFSKGKPQGTDCSRVDYALVDRDLKDKVVEMTYLENPEERVHSDHAPFILEMVGMDDRGSQIGQVAHPPTM